MVLVASSQKSLKRKARVTLIMVISTIAVLGSVTLFLSFGFYVDSLNTIFPNVWAEGINISGMTIDEARHALVSNGYEEQAGEISLTVTLPYDIAFTVTGFDVGLKLDASEAVRAAHAFGREGSFLENEMTYIRSLFRKTELNELSIPDYDSSVIRTMSEEYAQIFNDLLFDSNLEITDNKITITKGTVYTTITADELYNYASGGMLRAIEQYTHLTERYIPEINKDDGFDLQSIFEYVHIDPVSSSYDPLLGNPESETYDPEYQGATVSKAGRTFDIEQAKEKLQEIDSGETITIPIVTLEPEISQDELRDMLYRDVLCERVTSSGSDSNRATNVRLAASAIDGLILQPGDIFSYNQVVGPRTEARGYKSARVIVSGEFDEDIGGGVCQVTSTIYAALIQTDIEIVSRTLHGIRVSYLYGGQDATVAYGSIDFQFKNNTGFPMMLEVITTGSITVTVRIHGTRTEEIYYQVESIEAEGSPIEMEIQRRKATQEDLDQLRARGIDLKPGDEYVLAAGYTGQIWEVWRYHYSAPDFENPDNRILDSDGNHVRTMYGRPNVYRMRPRVIVYREGSSQTPPPPTIAPPTFPPDDSPDPAETPPAEQPPAEPPADNPPPENPPSDNPPPENPPSDNPPPDNPPPDNQPEG